MLIAAAVGTIAAQSRAAESQSTPGVSDTHIKIGQTIAYSGPASSLATIGRTQAAITAWSTVPQTFLFTGTSRFRDPQHYPWTIGGDLSFVSETRGFAKFILTEKPDAKIAVLYQNDGYGKDHLNTLKAALGDKAKTMVVAEASYEVPDPTVDSQVVGLKTRE
jgi:hypothetical protein